jgi:RNA polymerase sigma-70 factor (ECF subfamily)
MSVENTKELGTNESDALSYLNDIYRYAMTLARNSVEADDLVQETYVRALNAIGRLRPNSNLKVWLFTILRNIWRNQLRSKHHRYTTSELDDSDSNPSLSSDPSRSPYSLFAKGINIQLVRDAINQLPPDHREIIILREYEDLSYQEIADVLNCPIGTVMSRLGRAREKLKVLLSSANSPVHQPLVGSRCNGLLQSSEMQPVT